MLGECTMVASGQMGGNDCVGPVVEPVDRVTSVPNRLTNVLISPSVGWRCVSSPRGADLTDAFLTGADLYFARLDGADLTGAIVTGVGCSNDLPRRLEH